MKKLIILYLLIAVITFLAGCAKDGATGPTGSQGPAGTNGSNGTNGTNGTNGNSNVQSSTFTVTAWTQHQNGTFIFEEAVLNVPNISQNIVDSGTVLVYTHNYSGTNAWDAMPFTFPDTTTNGAYYYNYSYDVGAVTISVSCYGFAPVIPSSSEFKVVILSATNRLANPTINLNNYEEVKAAFNLRN
jgi:hypothetical protein